MRPDSGEVLYQGKPWTRECLKSTGALIETPPIYGNLTARRTCLSVPPLWDCRKTGSGKCEDCRTPDTGKKRAGQFSLGMKQRLGIASALISHSDFLVLDVKCSPSQTVYAGV